MSDSYFRTDDLTVGYGKKALIRGIRIEVRRGEILTLIGPNGAGKSTILRSVSRQLALLGGTVFLEGRDMASYSGNELARRLALLFTDRARPELVTCFEAAAAGRYPYTGRLGILGKEDREKVRSAMELMQIWDLRDRSFSAVSDGQRQRVLLAGALCQEPELIVLDEPTSFLDVRHKLEFLGLLRNMTRERRIAVILSLHELDLAQKISDRVVCVKGDRIMDQGSPEEIFQEEKIRVLYDLPEGSFIPAGGGVELPAVRGESRVFVIGGGGSALPVYRRLQREGIPFATGVLNENDTDAAAARALANELFLRPAFEPVRAEDTADACGALLRCERVICTLRSFGPQNEGNRKLIRAAEEAGLEIER